MPESAAIWGEPATLSVTLIAAAKFPVVPGLNVTERLQLFPAVSVAPQPFIKLNELGFAPARAMPLIFSVALPGFDSTTT